MKFGKKPARETKPSVPREGVSVDNFDGKSADHMVYDPSKKSLVKPPRFIKTKSAAAVILFLLVAGTFLGTKFLALKKVIVANANATPVNLDQKLDSSAITTEADARINILFLGVGDSDHAGADLSDTIMVASIDPRTKDVQMLGIPRDLYVNIEGVGYDKINAAHSLGESMQNGNGPELAKKVVSKTLGIPIHYFIRTDFSGLEKAVDALGGVTVTVPQTLVDNEYPCTYNEKMPCGVTIPAGTYVMHGATALAYARCRKGNCGNDFGRARRQQQIIMAMRTKALALPTLVDPTKLDKFISVVGTHVRTDIQLDEMQKIYDLIKGVDQNTIQTTVLDNDQNNLVTTANLGGLSVVIPTAGNGDFSKIQLFVRKLFFDGLIKRENATIAIKNATGNPAMGKKVADFLKSYSYNIISVDEVESAKSALSSNSVDTTPATLLYLEKRFKLKAVPDTNSNSQITLTIGTDLNPTYDTNQTKI